MADGVIMSHFSASFHTTQLKTKTQTNKQTDKQKPKEALIMPVAQH